MPFKRGSRGPISSTHRTRSKSRTPRFILQWNRLLSRRLITVPLIEFPPAGVTDVAQSPYLRRLIRSGRVVGSFVAVQIIVQLLGFLSGILLIRILEQREYAFFTIANTMQGTLNLLADVGISVGLVSICGRSGRSVLASAS